MKRVQRHCTPEIPNHFWKGERRAKEREEIEGRRTHYHSISLLVTIFLRKKNEIIDYFNTMGLMDYQCVL